MLFSGLSKKGVIALLTLLPYVLGIALAAFLWWYRYEAGYDRGVKETEAKIQKAVQEERLRQIEANNESLQQAQRKLEELRKLADERSERIQQLLKQGSSDPDAGRQSLSPNSVRRLNQIR